MKNQTFIIGLLLVIFYLTGFSQNEKRQLVKTVTNPEQGSINITGQGNINYSNYTETGGTAKDASINWNYTDAASIGSKVRVSADAGMTFNSWWLNSPRVSLYGNSSTPLWEQPNNTEWEYPIDMTEDGQWAVVAYDSVAQVYATSASSVFWEIIVDGNIIGVKFNEDGSKIFIAENDDTGNSKVSAWTVGNNTSLWETPFTGAGTVFTASGNGSRLLFGQYPGPNTLWVLDGETGEILFSDYFKNQYMPGISYDGNVIVSGDYSGYVYVYEYDSTNNSYEEKWNYKVGGGGTSVWVAGMAVSGDGSTVAVGTLIFLSSGAFEGEIYMFNEWSPVPVWIFSGAGDMVISLDFSFDGSLLAAASWGPLDNSKPDFFLFRKESAVPVFDILTQGSFNAVDISDDGTLCSVTGKAVHARVLGSGGILYNVNSDPGGGAISGNITLENAIDYSNVKIKINELEDYYGYSNADGSYEVKYIPEGTYSVTASLVGYYPETVNNVVITEGNTENLDFTLSETGNPPYDLTATQGAGLSVDLSWNLDNAGDVLGFNIYRKTIEGDLFSEEPIATVANNVTTYSDTDVLPVTTYYYAVTAIIETNIQSPYSNIATGWMSSGFVTDKISAYTGTTPVIDGMISAGEWDDAFMLDASDFLGIYDNMPNPDGSVTMYFKVNPAMTELYVACINENDTVLEDHDEVALYIDDNNDGTYPESGDDTEGNYWAAYYSTGSEIRYRPIYSNGGVGTTYYFPEPEIAISDATGMIVYEFVLPIGPDSTWQINPSAQNQSGLFAFTLDDPNSFDSYWPCWNQQIFAPIDYGVITYDATDEIPAPPDDVAISWTAGAAPVLVTLSWSQPDVNDFDHFNIYKSTTPGNWELLDSTIGTQFFYLSPTTDYTEFYITTVDHSQQESDPSEIVAFDITIGQEEYFAEGFTSVYPNPSSGLVNISVDIDRPGFYKFEIYNLRGQIEKTVYEGNLQKGIFMFQWDARNDAGVSLSNGIYLLSSEGRNDHSYEKIIVTKRR